jgi:hypothetical protein
VKTIAVGPRTGRRRDHDRLAFTINAPDHTVVLSVPLQNLTGGNLQAHDDLPHK